MSSSKGQSANELLVIYMFIMLVFTLFVASFGQQRSAEMENAKVSLADSVGNEFSYELNLAARSGSGYSRRIVYPVLLDGVTPYNIIVNNISKSIDIQFSMGTVNYSHSFPLITSNVLVTPQINVTLPNGTAYGYVLQSSSYNFSTGQLYIQNINKAIIISLMPSYAPNPFAIAVVVSGSYYNGVTKFANITATVTDSFQHPVPDGALVHFQTTNGVINDFVPTTSGTATAFLMTNTTATVNATISGVGCCSFPFIVNVP
jgi:hypothetical protein